MTNEAREHGDIVCDRPGHMHMIRLAIYGCFLAVVTPTVGAVCFLFLQLLFRRLDYLGGVHGFLGLTFAFVCFSDLW